MEHVSDIHRLFIIFGVLHIHNFRTAPAPPLQLSPPLLGMYTRYVSSSCFSIITAARCVALRCADLLRCSFVYRQIRPSFFFLYRWIFLDAHGNLSRVLWRDDVLFESGPHSFLSVLQPELVSATDTWLQKRVHHR